MTTVFFQRQLLTVTDKEKIENLRQKNKKGWTEEKVKNEEQIIFFHSGHIFLFIPKKGYRLFFAVGSLARSNRII